MTMSLNKKYGESGKRKRVQGALSSSKLSLTKFMVLTSSCLFLIVLFHAIDCHAANTATAKPNQSTSSSSSSTSSASGSSSSTKTIPRREKNLDHWDADTLAFYLNLDATTFQPLKTPPIYPGYDVAILFYAPWCRNCHALAPYWDRIATMLQAGTSAQSKLIMALFDCERNIQHEKICTAASVTHYPTLMFVGSGPYHDTDVVSRLLVGKKRSAGPAGPSNLPNAVKFQGNWKLPDSILDWIRAMKWLSRWHVATTQGWLRVLRNGILGTIFPPLRSKASKAMGSSASLPVGLPSSSTTGGTTASGVQVSLLQKQVNELTTKTKDSAKLILRSSAILDAFLFPVGQLTQVVIPNTNQTTTGKFGPGAVNATNSTTKSPYAFDNFTDVFHLLDQRNGWDLNITATKTDPTTYVILSCALDVMLDVCDRVSTHVTRDVATNYPYDDIFYNYTRLEQYIDVLVADREPYCGIVEMCLKKNFEPTACRPPTCPFRDPTACRYLTACLTGTIQTEYALALKLIEEGEKFPPPAPKLPASSATTSKTTSSTAATQDTKKDDKKGGVSGKF